MAEYQITRWCEIPSLVTAREGDQVAKISLSSRFQEAIDEAAMRLGAVAADAYLEGWLRDPWVKADGTPQSIADLVAEKLEEEFSQDKLNQLLDTLGTK